MNYKIIEEFDEDQLKEVHSLFKNEWWTKDRQLSEIRKMVENSGVVIGLIDKDTEELIGFARVITDTLYRAFIFDVIAKENSRNSGIGTILMNSILEHPLVREVDRVELYCPERLVGYYEKFGFSTDVNGSNLMRYKKNVLMNF
ncbi:GNAT family N-acetyltransferase [Psychrobacillus sp. L4]|uniref:GNAT family N-acetyltransferase n=1 Tax=Psychrobacillus sp. L4 TaxID=3236892 RepID=UPI0036F21757